jgi:hypothetical protein
MATIDDFLLKEAPGPEDMIAGKEAGTGNEIKVPFGSFGSKALREYFPAPESHTFALNDQVRILGNGSLAFADAAGTVANSFVRGTVTGITAEQIEITTGGTFPSALGAGIYYLSTTAATGNYTPTAPSVTGQVCKVVFVVGADGIGRVVDDPGFVVGEDQPTGGVSAEDFANGLSLDESTGKVGLGGELTKETTVEMGENHLNFYGHGGDFGFELWPGSGIWAWTRHNHLNITDGDANSVRGNMSFVSEKKLNGSTIQEAVFGTNTNGDGCETFWKVINWQTGQQYTLALKSDGKLYLNGVEISSSPGEETAESIRTKLESLTGEDRLDASAIKNLPDGGASDATAIDYTQAADATALDGAFSGKLNVFLNRLWHRLTQAFDRANHTGTQLAATISDFTATARAAFTAGSHISISSGQISVSDTASLRQAQFAFNSDLDTSDEMMFYARIGSITAITSSRLTRNSTTIDVRLDSTTTWTAITTGASLEATLTNLQTWINSQSQTATYWIRLNVVYASSQTGEARITLNHMGV